MNMSALSKRAVAGFSENNREITALAAVFFIGLTAGAIASVNLSGSQNSDISGYIDSFFSAYAFQGADKWSVCLNSIAHNVKPLLIMCISLVSVWLMPLLMAQFALRGFKMGFSISFLAHTYGLSGVIIGLPSFFWHILFTLPALIFCGAYMMKFSLKLKGGGRGFLRFKHVSGKVYIKLIAALIAAVVVIALGGLFDGYAATLITLSLCGIVGG